MKCHTYELVCLVPHCLNGFNIAMTSNPFNLIIIQLSHFSMDHFYKKLINAYFLIVWKFDNTTLSL